MLQRVHSRSAGRCAHNRNWACVSPINNHLCFPIVAPYASCPRSRQTARAATSGCTAPAQPGSAGRQTSVSQLLPGCRAASMLKCRDGAGRLWRTALASPSSACSAVQLAASPSVHTAPSAGARLTSPPAPPLGVACREPHDRGVLAKVPGGVGRQHRPVKEQPGGQPAGRLPARLPGGAHHGARWGRPPPFPAPHAPGPSPPCPRGWPLAACSGQWVLCWTLCVCAHASLCSSLLRPPLWHLVHLDVGAPAAEMVAWVAGVIPPT